MVFIFQYMYQGTINSFQNIMHLSPINSQKDFVWRRQTCAPVLFDIVLGSAVIHTLPREKNLTRDSTGETVVTARAQTLQAGGVAS